MEVVSLNKFEVPDVIPVDKKFTRTYYQEDSLLSNLRRALPKQISVKIFEESVSTSVSEEEYQFLLNYYRKRTGANGEAYLLRTIPQRLSVDSANRFMSEGLVTEEERQYLFQFYSLDEKQSAYVLKDDVAEADEIKILQMFHLRNLHIKNVEKAMISDILEKVSDLPKKDQFYSNLFTPTGHKFFLPPNLKHHSGMELTEAARLMYIAVCHKYGGVPFDGITFALLKLNSEYFQYSVLNKPVKYETKINSLKLNKDTGAWRFCDMEFLAYQDNLEVCKINVVAAILPLAKYKDAKSEQEQEYEIDPRYRILDKFKNNISIRYEEDGITKKWICTVENISQLGFMIQSEGKQPLSKSVRDKELEFLMHFDIAGFVTGKCKMKWFKADSEQEDHYFAGFSISQISPLDEANLKEAIGRYGRLMEEREIS